MLLAALDASEIGGLLFGERTSHAEQQQLHVAGDRVERRSQLVRHRGQEVGLRAIRDVGLVSAPLDLLRLSRESVEQVRQLRRAQLGRAAECLLDRDPPSVFQRFSARPRDAASGLA